MPSERIQRRIESLLDQAEEASDRNEWSRVLELVAGVLHADTDNEDALTLKGMAEASLSQSDQPTSAAHPEPAPLNSPEFDQGSSDGQPTSFASGRYTVSKFLGEGGKKRVYLAHDNTLDRDVAFALIKTEGLDETSRERVKREAQAMGRMGTHPCIMPIYDLGEETDASGIAQPFMVQPLMSGGDVEGLVEDAEGPLELDRALEIATQTAQGLSFAHSKGIVHRDLKPGNVWLDEDGAAKIGDFGLAVATDRSRLTVEKVIVGTVSYMPPEQATGGEVTPRADLYSLGAMLYEMSTGRVPFMGDDDIGIISQHINTPPVAPSWHNNQIPKTLDSLILRLLAKDPAERPDSADEVLASLEAVDLTAVEEREEGSPGSLDAMAGGVFVGRHREMDQLKSIFEDVLSGRGRMVTLVGEPGIGKTRTAQELATYAGMRGAGVLWGRSYESGGAPPYWPWVQAIRSHVAATEPQELRNQLGATAPVIAEVVSDVRTKLPDVPAPPPIEDPESARFRLFDSISTFLKNISSSTPLILMLEDLHWSDKPSLTLLEFVARELANSRILIVGNYRDMELNRRHPLSVTLGDLTRERLFERVVLRGLQRHDVERFIEISAGIAPPAALVDTVHSQTEGNPLFVTETVRLLIQEGDITSGQSSKGGTTSWEIRIPEGVREVIGRRLDRLSERCNEVLTTAAVIGRQFRFDVLKTLVDETTDNQLLDMMDEALSGRIIEEIPDEVGLYQFTHAQMQETLTSELSANRLVRMHARIGEALEEYYGDEADSHAAELVEQFAEAETVLGSEILIQYAATAGKNALSQQAFDSGADYFKIVLDRQPNSEVTESAHLNYDYARCLSGSGDTRGAIPYLKKSFDSFYTAGQFDQCVTVASYPLPGSGNPDMIDLTERAITMVPPGSEKAGLLNSRLGWLSHDREKKSAAYMTALRIADELGDAVLAAWTRGRMSGGFLFQWNLKDAVEYGSEAANLAEHTGEYHAEVHSRYWGGEAAICAGEIDVAREHINKIRLPAERTRAEVRKVQAAKLKIDLDLAIGDEVDASSIWPYLENRHLGDNSHTLWKLVANTFERGQLGSDQSFEQRASHIVGQTQWQFWSNFLDISAPLQAHVSRAYGNRKMALAASSLDRPIADESKQIQRMWMLDGLCTAGLLASMGIETLRSVKLDELFEDYPNSLSFSGLSTKRIHGLVANSLNLHDKAASLFQESLDFCRPAGYRPELAWTCADYADMLLKRDSHGDREKAIELQDEAISIATELGMKPLLERVLSKREILKA